MATRPRAVDDYLRELERSLRDVPRDRRGEIVTEIEAHIDALLAEHGPAPSEADARNVLERVGHPDDIAREAREESDEAPVRRRWTDVAAVIALPFPVVGWIVGAVLLWMSDVWDTRDKIIGTVAGPGVFVLGGLGTVAASNGGTAGEPAPLGPEPYSGGADVAAGDTLGAIEIAVLALVFLVPVAAAIYLARKLRTPPEPDGRSSGPGGPPIGDLSAIALLLLPFLLIVIDAVPALAVVYVLWSAGIVLLWLSDSWSARAKTLATVLAPGGGSLGLLLLQAPDDSDLLGVLAVAIFAIAGLVPPIYLGRTLRGAERRPPTRDLADAH
jgi:hypothetical protein